MDQPRNADMRLVIAASALGTIFEWYDFFIYGTLGPIIGRTFFPAGNETLQLLLTWAGFAVGFGFRPLGAVLFGYLGDRLGRKYTFLVTVTLMGIATAGVGLVPSAAAIGLAAPIVIVALRVLQGLALGGEYGGAAVYVAEHAPPGRRGYYTSFIQASVVGGFLFSIVVVLLCQRATGAAWQDWGWRLPFLISLGLLAVSLWMRLKLSESPVFRAMREKGELARNPFAESFSYPGNKRRLLVALFGVSAGMTVIWYTAMFFALSFLKGPMRLEDTAANLIVGAASVIGIASYQMFGRWSDRVGRKLPIVLGCGLALVLLFPLFHVMGMLANPGLAAAAARAPVVVTGPDCGDYNPFAAEQAGQCGRLLSDLVAAGVPYRLRSASDLSLTIAGRPLPLAAYAGQPREARTQVLGGWLTGSGYALAKVTPTLPRALGIVAALATLMGIAAMTYAPLAALLTEMFPARIRYSSMSIPYHFGTGYFGGFLPLISLYIVARSGDPYAGLWYTWAVVAIALVIDLIGLKGGPPRDHGDPA